MTKTCKTCKPHVFQDKRFGKGRRVHNPTAGGSKGTIKDGWTCTVCGRNSAGSGDSK